MPNWVDARICRKQNKKVLRAKWKRAPAGTEKEKLAKAKMGLRYMINAFFVREPAKRLTAIRKLQRFQKGKSFKRAIKLLKGGRVKLCYTGANSYKVFTLLRLPLIDCDCRLTSSTVIKNMKSKTLNLQVIYMSTTKMTGTCCSMGSGAITFSLAYAPKL